MQTGEKIFITGGTGFIGQVLCAELIDQGYEVAVLSRRAARPPARMDRRIRLVQGDPAVPGPWMSEVATAQAVVNLAGENIAASLRWSARSKKRILDSRLAAAAAVTEAIARAPQKPRVVVQSSAVGFYGNGKDRVLDESSPPGTGFLAEVAGQWEAAAAGLSAQGLRCAVIRTGVVLGAGGFLSRVSGPVRFFAGGHPGSGQQWLSWIHLRDEAGAIRYLLETEDLEGPFNLTAPGPVTAQNFFQIMGRVLRRPSWLHPPGFMLRLVLGQLANELLLSGQRVLPQRLLQAGYRFQYPDLAGALKQIFASGNDH